MDDLGAESRSRRGQLLLHRLGLQRPAGPLSVDGRGDPPAQTPVRWCCYLRPEGIGRQEIALLKRAGLYAVELGTDAASDTTLRSLGKGFTFADALEVNRACVAERLPCAHFVMFGGPGETLDTVAEGLANLERLEHTVVFAFSGIRILPGTALHGRAIAEDVLSPETSLREPVYYLSPQI